MGKDLALRPSYWASASGGRKIDWNKLKRRCKEREKSLQMTDNEIIKALECCHEYSDCGDCQYGMFRTKNGLCVDLLHKGALDLINRQKSKIDQLKTENKKMFGKWEILDNATKKYYADLYTGSIEVKRAEAIEEFAEKLKEKLFYECGDINYTEVCDTKRLIDNLAKEMTEGENNA